MNVVGDEYHFLLTCPAFGDLFIKYLKPYYCRWPTLNKFDRLMTSTSKVRTEGPESMKLNLKSQHRQWVGKKIHKAQQNIFRQHTRRAEQLALSQQGSHPAKFQREGRHNKQQYNEDKPLILGHRLSF